MIRDSSEEEEEFDGAEFSSGNNSYWKEKTQNIVEVQGEHIVKVYIGRYITGFFMMHQAIAVT